MKQVYRRWRLCLHHSFLVQLSKSFFVAGIQASANLLQLRIFLVASLVPPCTSSNLLEKRELYTEVLRFPGWFTHISKIVWLIFLPKRPTRLAQTCFNLTRETDRFLRNFPLTHRPFLGYVSWPFGKAQRRGGDEKVCFLW